MKSYIKQIENRLNECQKKALQDIFEPTVVGVPLADSRRDVCVLPDGEIRSYLRMHGNGVSEGVAEYIYSVDGGISWTKGYSDGKMQACTYVEEANVYLSVADKYSHGRQGFWCLRSKVGPDDREPQWVKVSDDDYYDSFLPVKSAFSNRVWITAQKCGTCTPTFFYSDDFGLTWNARAVEHSAEFELKPPHKGLRWCKGSGSEPYAVELSDSKMMMLIRTPTDQFYRSFSYDGGDSWTTSEPSFFYGINTTPFLLRMSDGRVVAFWNNTKSLPEVDHTETVPFNQSDANGYSEDAFTNRDAAHCAVTDDNGVTWHGFREVLLNEIRNNSDFRYKGGVKSSNDKSVHQFQAFELPYNKVLVSCGQNVASRRFVIFDIAWLYEQNAKEDFLTGLSKVSTQVYLKSLSGHTAHKAGNGHCAWNRTNGAVLMPDPDGGYDEYLYISKHHDDRLVFDTQGVVWNFPMSRKGTVKVNLKPVEKSVRFTLTDRWYNPCDEFASSDSPFSLELSADDIGTDMTEVIFDYDVDEGVVKVMQGEKILRTVKMAKACPTGISYLMIQCACIGDSKGVYVKSMEKCN